MDKTPPAGGSVSTGSNMLHSKLQGHLTKSEYHQKVNFRVLIQKVKLVDTD